MNRTLTCLLVAGLLALPVVGAQAQAADAASAAGADPTAHSLAKPDDTNAARAKAQPYNNAPFWRGVRGSGDQPGTISLPGAEKGVLIQSFTQYPGSRLTTAGEAWRQVRNHWVIPYGGALLVIVVLALGIFYKRRGPIGQHGADTGRVIERFTPFERAAHWSNAIAFVVLAVSGLVMAFGKFTLLPLIGSTLFGGLTYVLKTLHNFAGPLFAVSLVIVFFTFLRSNFYERGDAGWVAKGGGFLSGQEPPSGRFNAGEKIVFWLGVLVLGFFVVSSGLTLDKLLPGLAYTRGDMQIAHMIHAVSAVLMMALFLAHIYIGTIGMKGAYRAMRDGYVDETWAREHHERWYADIKAGRVPAQRSAPPGGDAASAKPTASA